MRVTAAKDGVLIRRRLRIFAAAAALVLLCAVCVGGVSGADVWDGTADTTWYTNNPSATTYTITTAEQLAGLAKLVNDGTQNFAGRTISLGSDLDLSGYEWVSIGYLKQSTWFDRGTVYRPFKGTFDGAGYTISGLTQRLEWGEEGGLFGYVAGGTITGVTLTDSTFVVTESSITLGSIVGILEDGNVNNCDVSSVAITSNIDWGSLGGILTGIFGSHVVGGAVGLNDGGVVSGYNINVDVEENLRNSWLNSDSCIFGEIVGKGGYLSAPSYYTITIDVGEHGSADPSDTIAYLPGDSATYSFTPDSGYAVLNILVDGVDSTEGIVFGDPRTTQTYSFTDIDRNHAISVTFTPAPEFTIKIPASLVIEEDTRSGEMIITTEDMWIPETAHLSLSVSSANAFKLVHKKDDSVYLPYSLTVGESTISLSNDEVFATFTQVDYLAMDSTPIQTVLNARYTGTPKYAGVHEDILTFTVTYNTE